MGTFGEKPLKVVAVLARKDGRLLLMGRKNPVEANVLAGVETYTFVGGRIEQGETKRVAALRELKEEVAIAGAPDGLAPTSPDLMRHVGDYRVILEESGKPGDLSVFFYDADADGVDTPLISGEHRKDTNKTPVPMLLADNRTLQAMRQRSFKAVNGEVEPGDRLLLPNHIIIDRVIKKLERQGRLTFTPKKKAQATAHGVRSPIWRPIMAGLACITLGAAIVPTFGRLLAPAANAQPEKAPMAPAGPCDGLALSFDFGAPDDGRATLFMAGSAHDFVWRQLPDGGIAAPDAFMQRLPGAARDLVSVNAAGASVMLTSPHRPHDMAARAVELAHIVRQSDAAVCGGG